jgi:hypothetical protein
MLYREKYGNSFPTSVETISFDVAASVKNARASAS